jgi:sulfotransferase
MPKTFHFLAGLPRSGSTVLAALLNQHPSVHASGTSGMGELMFNTFQAWKNSSAEQAAPQPEQIKAVLRGIMDTKYSNVDKPVVIDKARNWAEASTHCVF